MAERYFSVPFPNHPALVQLQNYLRRVLPEGTVYSDPNTFHLTLLYAEDDNGADLSAVSVPEIPIFGVGGSYVRRFPAGDKGEPVVLETGGNMSLYVLQGALYYAAVAAGAKISALSYPHSYRPHITLAYTAPRPVDTYGEPVGSSFIWEAEGGAVHLEVRSFSLQADGYETLQQWDLRGTVNVQEQRDALATEAETETVSETNARETPPHTSPAAQENAAALISEMNSMAVVSDSLTTVGERRQLEMFVTSPIKGKYPHIELAPDIEREEGDIFVTLPIGQFGSRSRNERTYTETAMRQMAAQINERRPHGAWGHLKDDEFGTRFDPPPVRWLAAAIVGDMVWGKARLQTDEARNYFKNAKKDSAQVGTSLFAWVEMDGDNVIGLDLITIDLADPARVGVPMTAAVPVISTEMGQPGGAPDVPEPVGETTHEEQERMAEQHLTLESVQAERDALHAQVTEFTAARDKMAELLGSTETVAALEALMTEHSELLAEAVTSVIASECQLESARPLVAQLVAIEKPRTREQVRAAVKKVLESSAMKAVIEATMQAQSGDPLKLRGSNDGKTTDAVSQYHDVPADAKAS